MKPKAERKRLDILLVERGLAENPQKALGMVLAGEVRVEGKPAEKAGMPIGTDARIDIASRVPRFVSRGGLKLEGALEDFAISPQGWVCIDIGSSTGGFTDCLLQSGALRIYAVDVNTNQLAWKLQQDQRVIRIKRNARALKPPDIPEPVDLVVADVSFISAGKVLGPATALAKQGAAFLILTKPQFELRREDVGPGGVVKNSKLHEAAIAAVQRAAEAAGLECIAVHRSRLLGAEGNQEYFLHARKMTME
jgi:23S rRNA (cytidine1920-2'-O)/16S rRNA (cytidine1409-2'-O)-methyltransferase